jgi:beta-lactamase superfamily II metal-dependent hydrolase
VSIVKSFAIGLGDMYYVQHNSDNFTIIDCSLPDERSGSILAELKTQSKDKGITRFVSTHPDQDHISGLELLDDTLPILNFYCVKNAAKKSTETTDFKRYRQLHDDTKKAFYLSRECTRRWMNQSDDDRKQSGIDILWPILGNEDHESALVDAANGMTPNNISCIVKYSINEGATFLWMGDLHADFMEKIKDNFTMPKVDVLFAPHHGRNSGKVPSEWLEQMDPGLIVVGEAPSEHLHYYPGYNTLTQNSCGDALFDCVRGKIRIYLADHAYAVDYLDDEGLDHEHGLYYVGTLKTHR